MAYVALYRKWRPKGFSDLVGQPQVSQTLSRAIETGKIGHAYLFAGPRGTGKTSTAKILAKAMNCEHGPTPDPCGDCENCKLIDSGASMDVMEIDAASNRGIDEIRELRETVKFAPAAGRYKVYIIDEVHMLTTEAFNALLKTLEEPPPQVLFILATTEAHKVPATIKSRCQRYDFRRITTAEIVSRLAFVAKEQGIEIEDAALDIIARQADGGMRDALGILDQCAALSRDKITAVEVQNSLGLVGQDWIANLTSALHDRNGLKIIELIAELLSDGKDPGQIVAELSLHLRGLMVYQAAGAAGETEIYTEPEEMLASQVNFFPPQRLMEMIQVLHKTMGELKWSPQPRVSLEVAFLSLIYEQPSSAIEGRSIDGKVSGNVRRRSAEVAPHPSPKTLQSEPVPLATTPATTQTTPKVASASVAPAATDDVANGAKLWQQVLDTYRAANKRMMLACLDQGKFQNLSDNRLTVIFPHGMMSNMAMTKYKKNVETMFKQISGRELEFFAVASTPATPTPPTDIAPSLSTDTGSPPPQNAAVSELPAVQKALSLFGGELMDMEEPVG